MPLSQATASVIGSGMGLIGNLFSGLGGRRSKKYAKEMMDYQNELELKRMEQQFGYQQQAASQELTRAEAAKTKAETVAETGIGMAQRVLDALGKAKENKKTDVDIKKVEKEVENIDAAIQVANENANVLKENKELLAYQNKNIS